MQHRKTRLITLVLAALFGASMAAFAGCTSLLGDFEVGPTTSSEAGGPEAGNANGAACAASTECGSGFCTDGVCCESACSGTCESCGIDKGKCVAVPDGQDPDKECLPAPVVDAGAAPEPDAAPLDDGGGSDADAGDGGASDAGGEPDAAGQINTPDGGFVSSDDKCAGSCNGNRACKFPGVEATCGTKFCNTGTQAGRFACDGKGRCELGLEACQAFSCEGDGCRTSCALQSDCLSTHYCDQGVCKEKLGDGLGCGLPDQCKNGFCVFENGSGVCCNSACSIGEFGPGATCKKSGAVGQCKCSIDCGTGSCRLYYRDFDGDGFGDIDGIAPTTAKVGCDNAPPPAGYVADNTDCDDKDGRAFPGQTGYFADTTLGKGSNDFNCDGAVEKETREYPGATCYECGAPKTCAKSTSCAPNTGGTQTRLTCDLYSRLVFCIIGQPCPSPYSCGYSTFVSNTAGFTTTVGCGVTSPTFKTCGTCPSSTFTTSPSSTTASKQQRCH